MYSCNMTSLHLDSVLLSMKDGSVLKLRQFSPFFPSFFSFLLRYYVKSSPVDFGSLVLFVLHRYQIKL